jgi:hypothetical protein
MKSLIDDVLTAPHEIDNKYIKVGDVIYWYPEDQYLVLDIGPERFLLQDINNYYFRHGSLNFGATYKVKTSLVTNNLIHDAKIYARTNWNARVVEQLGL